MTAINPPSNILCQVARRIMQLGCTSFGGWSSFSLHEAEDQVSLLARQSCRQAGLNKRCLYQQWLCRIVPFTCILSPLSYKCQLKLSLVLHVEDTKMFKSDPIMQNDQNIIDAKGWMTSSNLHIRISGEQKARINLYSIYGKSLTCCAPAYGVNETLDSHTHNLNKVISKVI